MQSAFCRLCSFYYISEPLLQRHGGRLPFPKSIYGADNLKAMLLQDLRRMITDGEMAGNRYQKLQPLMQRTGIYAKFFEGDLTTKLFQDSVWWEAGVFG